MNIQMVISCECGNTENVSLKRVTEENDGRVYSDILVIEDTLENSKKFRANQSHPDETTIQCLECQKKQDVSL